MDTYILLGALGGLLPDVLRFINAVRAQNGKIPPEVKEWGFLISLVLLAGLGALTVWLVGATSPKEAVALGFGAPEVISRLAKPKDGGQIDRGIESQAKKRNALLNWWKH